MTRLTKPSIRFALLFCAATLSQGCIYLVVRAGPDSGDGDNGVKMDGVGVDAAAQSDVVGPDRRSPDGSTMSDATPLGADTSVSQDVSRAGDVGNVSDAATVSDVSIASDVRDVPAVADVRTVLDARD